MTAAPMEGTEMEEFWVEVAKRAGLEKALAEFRDDVEAAAKSAATAAAGIGTVADTRAEPWPPMQMETRS
ncbi:hypothetical protein [Acidisphaera sp. L21]|uniref:hypothetical protein n=1 Tax=Acidisphaera sp. L21 TaxID=1641851 RepID=UPI00131EC970|nr:hypothetical protein [Acidisphaera sp. L21]